MKVTPRKEEVARVVEVLESETFGSSAAMAKEVIKVVADLLGMRSWWIGAVLKDGKRISPVYGPFSSETECTRAFKKAGLGDEVAMFPIYGGSALLAAAEGREDWADFCSTCGHPTWWHSMAGSSRGKCVSESCDCEKFVK